MFRWQQRSFLCVSKFAVAVRGFWSILSPRVLLHSNSQDHMTNCHGFSLFLVFALTYLASARWVWVGWQHRSAQGKSWRRLSVQLLARVFRTLTSFVYFCFEERVIIPINLAGIGLLQQYALVFCNKTMNQVVSKVSKLSLLCFEKKKWQNGSVSISFHQSDKVHCSSNPILKSLLKFQKIISLRFWLLRAEWPLREQQQQQHTCVIKWTFGWIYQFRKFHLQIHHT